MVLSKILSQSAFWIVNKEIARLVGIEPAVLLSDLIDKQTYFSNRNELDSEGYFFNTVEFIELATSLNYHAQKKALKVLSEHGFIEEKLKGIPAKLHFKVVEYKILNYLNTGVSISEKLDLDKPETNNNIIINNKKKEVIIPLFNEITPISHDVLKYLNEKKPSKVPFKLEKNNLKEIEARIKEKFTMAEFKKVIDFKISEWKDDEKMKKYIRPETLFGSKFNSYLSDADDDRKKDDGSANFEYKPTQKAQLL
jgi:phage conserved hypothetical protein, C-terminal domain